MTNAPLQPPAPPSTPKLLVRFLTVGEGLSLRPMAERPLAQINDALDLALEDSKIAAFQIAPIPAPGTAPFFGSRCFIGLPIRFDEDDVPAKTLLGQPSAVAVRSRQGDVLTINPDDCVWDLKNAPSAFEKLSRLIPPNPAHKSAPFRASGDPLIVH